MSAALASELRRLARLAQALVTGPPLGGVWPEMIVGDEPRLDAPAASDADPADAQRARTRWAARLGEVVHLKDAAYLPPELLDADGDGYVTAEELMAARPPRGERGDRGPRDEGDAAPAPR